MSSPQRGVTYDFYGIKHVQDGHGSGAIDWDEFAIFQILKELEKHGHWVAVRDLCEEQIRKTPEWLTPYLCAGVAYANLGQRDEATAVGICGENSSPQSRLLGGSTSVELAPPKMWLEGRNWFLNLRYQF